MSVHRFAVAGHHSSPSGRTRRTTTGISAHRPLRDVRRLLPVEHRLPHPPSVEHMYDSLKRRLQQHHEWCAVRAALRSGNAAVDSEWFLGAEEHLPLCGLVFDTVDDLVRNRQHAIHLKGLAGGERHTGVATNT